MRSSVCLCGFIFLVIGGKKSFRINVTVHICTSAKYRVVSPKYLQFSSSCNLQRPCFCQTYAAVFPYKNTDQPHQQQWVIIAHLATWNDFLFICIFCRCILLCCRLLHTGNKWFRAIMSDCAWRVKGKMGLCRLVWVFSSCRCYSCEVDVENHPLQQALSRQRSKFCPLNAKMCAHTSTCAFSNQCC